MDIRVGLTASDLRTLNHRRLSISGTGPLLVTIEGETSVGRCTFELASGQAISVIARDSELLISGLPNAGGKTAKRLQVEAKSQSVLVCLPGLKREGLSGSPCYRGRLELFGRGQMVRVALVTDLDAYVCGVLASEIPASYKLEAIKAQAVAARTYGLRPRISHDADQVNVCDSYLCCQFFSGTAAGMAANHERAIAETRGQILTYGGRPALALFSSCAGGHTESYENCFSDPFTGRFPPEPIAYLKGVPEGKLPSAFPSEQGMRQLWNSAKPETADAWSPHFRWKVTLPDRALEGHMHHVVDELSKNPEFAPFIVAPRSAQFGHLEKFEILKRGVSGCAISLAIHTSRGKWVITKELAIRSAFKNPDVKLSRLKSARMFFEHRYDKLGLLTELTIFGLGWGHGVGLQQTGAEGFARAGKTYREILSHYFPDTAVEKV